MQVPLLNPRAQHQSLRHELLLAVQEVLDSNDLLLGPNVRAFEAEFAAHCRTRFAVAVGSGTDALSLALRACGIRPGDEVITVAHTAFATIEAIARIGAVPVFVDVEPATYTLDPARIKPAISARTRAIVPVHLYGQMADMDAIVEIAQGQGLVVVADACQAHGAAYWGRHAGSIGDAAAFSFGSTANLSACGDGGAVTTNSRAIADAVRLLRNHGSVDGQQHQEIGFSSRLDELQAAILRVKLRHLDRWNERRRVHAAAYNALLEGLDLELPFVREGAQHVFNAYVIQTPDGQRDHIRDGLADRGVATGAPYTLPAHRQPAVQGMGRVAGDLSVTRELARRLLSLPVYPELEPQERAYVAACVQACLVHEAQVQLQVPV